MNFDQSDELQSTGDLKKDEFRYSQLMIKGDAPTNVFYNLGIICAKTGREEEAINLFKKYIYLEPKSPIAYNNLGLIFIKIQKYDEAIKNFLISLKFKQDSKTYFNLALTYEEIRKFKKAIYNYKAASKIDSKNAEALCNLGNLYSPVFMF